MKNYEIELEIAGPYACFTRPDTGDLPHSYEVPTFAAATCMMKSIAWWKNVTIIPQSIGICKPIRWMKYACNYRGTLRKQSSVKDQVPYQQCMIVLYDVCYKIKAIVDGERKPGQVNTSHAFQEFFTRKLVRGNFFTRPYLGLRSMGASYFGPFRDSTHVDTSINMRIPLLYRDGYQMGKDKAIFDFDMPIVNGELKYVI